MRCESKTLLVLGKASVFVSLERDESDGEPDLVRGDRRRSREPAAPEARRAVSGREAPP